MKKIKLLLFAAMLLAAPTGQLSARTTPISMMADETLSDATVQKVLDAAAPIYGVSAASLYADYQVGTVTITDLGAIRGGHRYEVSKSGASSVVIEIVNTG